MISKQTMIDRFAIATMYPNVEVLRKRLLKCCSTNSSNSVAAERAFDILHKTDLKDLVLDSWETFELSSLDNTAPFTDINTVMASVEDHTYPALNEISIFIPSETRDTVKEVFSTQAPLLRVAVMVFIVAMATMEDLL